MFEALLKNIAKGLDKLKIPYMIIGGQAVLLYGTPRLTKDIDITLGVDTDNLPELRGLCNKLKLEMLPKDTEKFVNETMVLPVQDPATMIRVDFIFSFSDYERQAIKRASKVRIKNYNVRFASVEDLIVHKIFSGRALDLEDIRNILIKKVKNIDISYIKKWLKKLQPPSYKEDLSLVFEKIFAEIKQKR